MWSTEISRLTALSPSQWCKAYFLLVSGAMIAIAVLPKDIKQLFIVYGSRTSSAGQRSERRAVQSSNMLKFARYIASSGRVPHSWFTSFYVTSTACSTFWAVQYLLDGRVLRFVTSRQATAEHASTSLGRTKFVWAIFALHGTRRLLEHLWVMRASAADMWLPHWLFGISFYLVMSVAIWIEGSGPLQGTESPQKSGSPHMLWASLWLAVFALASFYQLQCHKYLSQLRKYSLPDRGLFRYILCPHYTCECVIYLSLAALAAPVDKLYNGTILCALVLVTTNLGVTASGTSRWYEEKFGEAAVRAKWIMVPGLF